MEKINLKKALCGCFVTHKLRHYLNAIKVGIIVSVITIFVGLVLWPIFVFGWKLALSGTIAFLLFLFLNKISRVAMFESVEKITKSLEELGEGYLDNLIEKKIKLDKKFIKQYRVFYPTLLINLSELDGYQIREQLYGIYLNPPNLQTIHIDTIAKAKDVFDNLQTIPNAYNRFRLDQDGIFKLDSKGDSLADYILYKFI